MNSSTPTSDHILTFFTNLIIYIGTIGAIAYSIILLQKVKATVKPETKKEKWIGLVAILGVIWVCIVPVTIFEYYWDKASGIGLSTEYIVLMVVPTVFFVYAMLRAYGVKIHDIFNFLLQSSQQAGQSFQMVRRKDRKGSK